MKFRTIWIYLLAFLAVSLSRHSAAQVISPAAEEVSFEFTGKFQLAGELPNTDDWWEEAQIQARTHARYLFGVLHSPTLVAQYGLDPEFLEGLGGPRMPLTLSVTSVKEDEDGLPMATYRAYGRMLLHKKAVEKIVNGKVLKVFLPYNFDTSYLKKCTDSHYYTFDDYWYFWDPFRAGCEKLQDFSRTRETTLKIERLTTRPTETTPNLKRWLGDNGNGEKLKIYVINGFNEGPQVEGDEGRANFEDVRSSFEQLGYAVETLNRRPDIIRNRYTKTISNGRSQVYVEVIHQLANTDISAGAMTFARTFKEAAFDGDLIVYLGHSGLGANLDIGNLNWKLENAGEGGIDFNQDKYQIYFFDSCSSYSYYLPHFRDLKARNKIDIISYGLSSLFENSGNVFRALIEQLVNFEEPKPWEEILKAMEKPLGKTTFLLNVGAV